MKTVMSAPKIETHTESFDYKYYMTIPRKILAIEYATSEETAMVLHMLLLLQGLIEKDLKDIWGRLDELESKIDKT